MKSWYLLYTKPRQEQTAVANLERQGYHTYLPLIKKRKTLRSKRQDAIEPLFPNYLFIELDAGTDNWRPIRSTIGVNKMVQFGNSPAVAPIELIELIRSCEDEHGFVPFDLDAPKRGDSIQVAEGPLFGAKGIFLEKKGLDRVVVLLDIVGRQTRSVVDASQVEKSQ